MKAPAPTTDSFKFVDLFCGIGGFHYAAKQAAEKAGVTLKAVAASDIDTHCQDSYEENFGFRPMGDITRIQAEDIPDHDLLLAGFPCQPFSIIGQMQGFNDTRGTLFFDIARIIESKRPRAFVLENVKMLRGHNRGKTLNRILEVCRDLGYQVDFRILNALDFGLPQKRERIFIVGFRDAVDFVWPEGNVPMKQLDDVLEQNPPQQYYASEAIRAARIAKQEPTAETTVWHENKSGNISAYPYACALRAGASYNYLLVNGERRLTGREMLRLQGFPDSFKIIKSYTQTRKQAGNSLPVPVAGAVLTNVLTALKAGTGNEYCYLGSQGILMEENADYGKETTLEKR